MGLCDGGWVRMCVCSVKSVLFFSGLEVCSGEGFERDWITYLMVMCIAIQNTGWSWHFGKSNERKDWISVSSLSSWRSLESRSRVLKALRTWSKREVA